jgi:outer membrane protein OmpA-like peptidoglycan-associated protein
MKNFPILIFLLCCTLSCATQYHTTTNLKKSRKNSAYAFVQTSELYTPIYAPNGGSKKQNFTNRGKVQKEREFIALLKAIPTPVKPKTPVGSSEADKVIIQAIESFNNKIFELERRLSKLDINSRGSEEEYANILIEINNLICNYQDGLMLLEKKVKKLYSDISFDTGSSVISRNGSSSINEIALNIEGEVKRWQRYLNSCNKKIFENDIFVLVVNIDGYADQRGDQYMNLKLSEERAKSVEILLRAQLVELVKSKNIKLVFNKIYTTGYGEKLPPGTTSGPENDPNRRICIIDYMVCPARYIK